MSKFRSLYNRGKLIRDRGRPSRELVSFAYDQKGFPINPRYTKTTRLKPEEIEAIRDKYAKADDDE